MNQTNPCVRNVPDHFGKIPAKIRKSPHYGSRKKYLGARNPDGMIKFPDYTTSVFNELGLGEHIQGVQRIGQYLVLSGGIKTGTRESQLIVIHMGSRDENGPWALPKYGHWKKPLPEDRIVQVKHVDAVRWHAGGIQVIGEVVAVPVYGDAPGSEIRFFDFSDKQLGLTEIESITIRKDDMKAKAVALTRLPNDSLMTMAWDDEKLHFHYGRSANILDGFEPIGSGVDKSEVENGFQRGTPGSSGDGTYQSLNLVVDTDGTVYMIATRNNEKASPTFTGKDYADLFKLSWAHEFEGKPRIAFLKQRQFYCYNQQCNFGAAAGIYAADENHLFLYGASHWLHDGNKRYNFNEYSYL